MAHFPHPRHHAHRSSRYWRLVGLACVVTFLLGAYGFHAYEYDLHAAHAAAAPAAGAHGAAPGPGQHLRWIAAAAYHSLQMFVLHTPHLENPNLFIEVARWGAAFVLLAATGRAIFSIFRSEVWLTRLGFCRGHTLVAGHSPHARAIARCCALENRSRPVVTLARTEAAGDAAADGAGATILHGDITAPDFLRRVGVGRAARLVVADDDDRTNLEVAVRALQVRQAAGAARPLACYVQVNDLELRAAFESNEVLQRNRELMPVRFFDLHESMARRLLREVLPPDHAGIAETDPRQPHLVLIGLGRLGRTIALKAAQLGHFANRRRLRLSVIDRHAGLHEQTLLFRHPRWREVCDLEFHALEAESVAVRERLEAWCRDPALLTSVAVCFDDDRLGFEFALRALPLLRTHRVPLAVRMAGDAGLGAVLEQAATAGDLAFYIRTFGSLDDAMCARAFREASDDAVAEAIQRRFLARGRADGRDEATDAALRPWAELAERYKDSNRQQADHLPVKIHAVDCELAQLDDPRPAAEFAAAEVELMADMEHRRWMAERLLAGWHWTPGARDDAALAHPGLKPWHELDERTKAYDRDTVRALPEIAGLVQRKICRRRALQ